MAPQHRRRNNSNSKSPYHQVADLLNEIWDDTSSSRLSLKTAAYDRHSGKLKVSKQTYAVAAKVLANRTLLQHILEQHQPVSTTTAISAKNTGLLYVLLYELLLSKNQCIQGGGALKRQILQHETALRQALAAAQQSSSPQGVVSTLSLFPRYLRVNTVQTTTATVIQKLQQELKIAEVYADRHVPDLLVVHRSATSTILAAAAAADAKNNNEWGNLIILQDKSSCFPALCLHSIVAAAADDGVDDVGDCLDACAAPGNKTSHLAALLYNTKIYAVERNDKRCQLLRQRMRNFPNVQVMHQDFLALAPSDYPTVKSILLDPSCSGSGMYTTNRSEDTDTVSPQQHRLAALSGFQITALRHAMSFANVNHIVYSTCSVHTAENECVVAAALQNQRETWQIVAPPCLASRSSWHRRGQLIKNDDCNNNNNNNAPQLTLEETECLIRVDRDDETNGFFVACLQRKGCNNQQQTTKPWRNTNLDLNIPIYNGQFAAANVAVAAPNDNDDNDNEKPASVFNNKNKKKRSLQEATESSNNDTMAAKIKLSGQQHNDVSNVKPMARKRAKKLAWKQRQREQKLARLIASRK